MISFFEREIEKILFLKIILSKLINEEQFLSILISISLKSLNNILKKKFKLFKLLI